MTQIHTRNLILQRDPKKLKLVKNKEKSTPSETNPLLSDHRHNSFPSQPPTIYSLNTTSLRLAMLCTSHPAGNDDSTTHVPSSFEFPVQSIVSATTDALLQLRSAASSSLAFILDVITLLATSDSPATSSASTSSFFSEELC
ncbi:hypothetical protein LOK49_LG13G00768 [Camellia lanceoleosa]|uniref:Uncharacterized protein n=1 Tax=Camellia lanceoleosa TaxID=1840588 RepID=A0ACC0FLV9_9ERIC|nr:hypothetical protein LOK49_LG13G00768 [Camellia lanceoleosa]